MAGHSTRIHARSFPAPHPPLAGPPRRDAAGHTPAYARQEYCALRRPPRSEMAPGQLGTEASPRRRWGPYPSFAKTVIFFQ